MVSRYGVSKEGAVGVAVGVGPMHCLLPPCGGSHQHHHLSAAHHPQNPQPGHNHHVHPAHQPPPSPSPHLNHQLSHHQLTVNINHLSHQQQQQQTQHQQAPPQYRVVTANARSDFHVSGQNYGTQPGGQVGGGGGSVGVPGGRGPPPLGGLQSIGQSQAGIPPGGPAGGQAPPQAPAPGVQSQQQQGPAPTTTPPVHTPSPQEMGKQAHLQPQPQPLSQVYGPTQSRPTSQGYYQPNPRQQQPRGISHRGGQGGTGAQVVGMSGVGGGGGQPTTIYHPAAGLPVQTGGMYQVPNLHPGAHQQSVYPMNNQIPLQFSGPPQRHQTHQNQPYYGPFQHSALLTTQNMFGYGGPAPTPQPYYWPTGQPANTPLSLSRAGASAVTGGAQHVAGPLAGAQGAPVVPQGTLQQPTQQTQPIPPIGISLSQTDVYSGHNGGATSTASSTIKSRKPRGQNAITDIVDPTTGKNISHEIYKDNETVQSSDSSNRETPQPQNNGAEVAAEVAADFAARVAKVATEESDSDSSVPTSAPDTTTSQNVTPSLSNVQTNSSNDANSQCNTGPPTPTQNIPNVTALCSQSLVTASNAAQIDTTVIKTESKPLKIPVKEFQPRSETKAVVIEEPPAPPPTSRIINKDEISAQLTPMTVTEVEVKKTSASPILTPSLPLVSVPSTNVPEVPKPSATAPSANPAPAREPFPNLSTKTSSSSPPRRKSQTHAHSQLAAATTELPPSAKEQKEKKREKSLSSRGTTPTPVHAQTEHQHQKANGDASGEKSESEVLPKNELQQQKSSDGKAMQKQKSKNKLKRCDLNRKGAEKEGTDMDAFVNTVPAVKTEIKQESKESSLPPKESNQELNRAEIMKDIKEKENYESKKEKEIISVQSKPEKHVVPPLAPEVSRETTPTQAPVIEKLPSNKETLQEASPKIEDNTKSNACNIQVKPVPNDVVDHAIVKEDIDVEAIVAQKNEENSKVSALRVPSEEKQTVPPVIDKQYENEQTQIETIPSSGPAALKYKYKIDQWSPLNKSGKKVYDREFLMKLQEDPNSKIKPSNLPDLDVVLKDSTKTRNPVDVRLFKDVNLNRSDNVMLPGFIRPALNARVPPRKSQPGRPKPTKPNVIHVSLSLREDVKLRETENAWKPTRMKPTGMTEEEAKTEDLYKRVRSVLNKLTPQKFSTLVEQVRALTIDTQERLQGVINLVFEKAVDEPSFSVAYALMCKELGSIGTMDASSSEKNSEKQDSAKEISFKKLIITRCQKEFEKNPIDEVARASKLKEIEECTDPEKKKDLQVALEEEERRIRIKSVGNIRFIGELYKQGMLTSNIMHRCVMHLLDQKDEDSLECLCKLLTTVGKDLEPNRSAEEMQSYFNRMQDIVARRGPGKISSRIRFMLQDVIDLRACKWIPRRDDSNPKTIDQIQKEAESERLDSQLNNTPLTTPRKDDRNSDRKRNRGVGPTDEGGWSQPVGRSRQPYSVETAKLKNKPPPMDDMQLGNRTIYMWKTSPMSSSKTINSNKFACLDNISTLDQDKQMSAPQLSGSRSIGPREYGRDYKSSYDGRGSRNGSHQLTSASSSRETSLLDSSQSQSVSMPPPSLKSASQSAVSSHKPPMTDAEFMKALDTILREYLKNPVVEKAALHIQQNFDTTLSKFVHESINSVLEKSPIDRELVSRLMSHLISQKILPIHLFRNGFSEILEIVDDLIIDIPKIWLYLAEILSHPIEEEVIPLSELKPIFANLRNQGYVGKFIGELLTRAARDKGPKWVAEKWDQTGLQLSNIIDPERENIDKLIKEYNLEFFTGDYNSAKSSTSNQLSLPQIQDELRKLMEGSTFDEICTWIMANVGNQVKEPEFIRILTTAILETSIAPVNDGWNFKTDTFMNLQQLIRRFVDTKESLELQCLYAIQFHLHKLQYPHGMISAIMRSLADYNIISSEAFLTWKKCPEPAQREWHGVATMALTSFFTYLQEPDDASSVEDVSTSANQDRC